MGPLGRRRSVHRPAGGRIGRSVLPFRPCPSPRRPTGRSGSLRSSRPSPLVAAVLAAGCSASASVAASFDPSAPCTADAKVPGAYPALEALIPAKVGDTAHVSAGFRPKLHGHQPGHAGRPRRRGGPFRRRGLAGLGGGRHHAGRVHGAGPPGRTGWGSGTRRRRRSARVTGSIQTTRPTIDGLTAYRMDLVNGEAPQTAITWPVRRRTPCASSLHADESEARIQEAIAAFGK